MADFAITPTTGRALSSSNSTTCGLIVERHVPKCAGTTVRTFLRANQERGACSYVGYDVGRTWQSRVGFTHRSLAEVADELNSNPSPWNKPICMEAHMVGGSFWSVLSSLRQSQFAARCTMLVMLRVREPLSWYRSYYDWAVLSRQKTGDSVQWGTNFTDWLPSNMQSRFLLHGTRNQPSQWAPEMARRRSGGLPQKLLEKRWAEIEKIVRSADVVSPLERLDDALALVVKRSGFLRTAEYVSTRPSDMRGPWERLPKVAKVVRAKDFCGRAGMDCAAAVKAAAPCDYKLYALAQELFARQWRTEFGSKPYSNPGEGSTTGTPGADVLLEVPSTTKRGQRRQERSQKGEGRRGRRVRHTTATDPSEEGRLERLQHAHKAIRKILGLGERAKAAGAV